MENYIMVYIFAQKEWLKYIIFLISLYVIHNIIDYNFTILVVMTLSIKVGFQYL